MKRLCNWENCHDQPVRRAAFVSRRSTVDNPILEIRDTMSYSVPGISHDLTFCHPHVRDIHISQNSELCQLRNQDISFYSF